MTASAMQTVRGHGIHGGAACTVHLHAVEGPLRLRRGEHEIPVSLEAAAPGPGCTVLSGDGGACVRVVEHLLAALAVRDVHQGLLIEAGGDELPILDGSALPWAEVLDTLSLPRATRAPWRPERAVEVRDGTGRARVAPGPSALDCRIDFPHPAVGRQQWRGERSRWDELLAARTFGFAADAAQLRAAGRAAGVEAGNAIVFGDLGPQAPLRFADEPVRHKALDALGDLHLLGRPLEATVTVERGTHRLHLRLMRALAQSPRRAEPRA